MEIAIGELSRRTQCNIETLRYYERIGLVPKPRRMGGRYRRYDDEDVARLRFIRRARQLGFTLDDIRAFMRRWNRFFQMLYANVNRASGPIAQLLKFSLGTNVQKRATAKFNRDQSVRKRNTQLAVLRAFRNAP